MAKAKKTTKAKQTPRWLWIGAAALVVVVVAIVVILSSSQPAAATAAKITPADYQSQFVSTGAPHMLVDVRTAEEFASGHIHGAVNIPVEELPQRLSEVPRDEMVVLYCHSGRRSGIASGILSDAGYTQIRDLGGINAWIDAGLPVE